MSGATEQPGAITVFLLDDHEVVRRGIKDLLESEGDIVVIGESGLADEAARRIPALRPDVAILSGGCPTAPASTSVARSGPVTRGSQR